MDQPLGIAQGRNFARGGVQDGPFAQDVGARFRPPSLCPDQGEGWARLHLERFTDVLDSLWDASAGDVPPAPTASRRSGSVSGPTRRDGFSLCSAGPSAGTMGAAGAVSRWTWTRGRCGDFWRASERSDRASGCPAMPPTRARSCVDAAPIRFRRTSSCATGAAQHRRRCGEPQWAGGLHAAVGTHPLPGLQRATRGRGSDRSGAHGQAGVCLAPLRVPFHLHYALMCSNLKEFCRVGDEVFRSAGLMLEESQVCQRD